MADEGKIGTNWEAGELDLIVADYFDMLGSELSKLPYVKAQHSAGLMSRIGRTHRSVEFKHQNISAVLDELGLPWIAGYKPKRNYQNALIAAVARYLTGHPEFSDREQPVAATSNAVLDSAIFVAAPSTRDDWDSLPTDLRRLIRAFDPAERDRRNRALGRAGEEFVFDVERRQLELVGRSDLAQKVRWVALEDGDGAGYDIRSFDNAGRERLLEVKTTNGSARTPFFLTRNECELGAERPADWCIYRVHRFSIQPKIFTVSPPLEASLHLRAETWRASL